MTAILDRKGNPIVVGSIVKVPGSKIERIVRGGKFGATIAIGATPQVSGGKIHAERADMKPVSRFAWIDPTKCEVIR